jgi:O-antigen/teichoic acid export membrane protein
LLRTAFLLAGSSGVVSAMRFGRNVLLARLIGVEDYGIASTFALLMVLVEMLSDLGLGRLVVQDREGDSPGFVAAIQGLDVVRGAILALLVFAFADPIASFFGQPGLGWAYRLLALVPLLHAAIHLDVMRQQRTMRFGLMIKADFAGAAASLAALWPLGLWLGDFRVMLGMLIVESLARVGTAHLLAERPYRLAWDRAVAARAMRFGWPLLAGGMLTFAVMQGERLIVANQLTATDLGLFSAALTLAMAPTLVVQRVINNMFLPLLARERDNEEAFLQKAELSLEALLVGGLGLMLLYVLAGPQALRLAYGPDFAAGAQLAAILGITFSLRMVRSAPTNISIAKGHTVNLLIANAVRLVSFPVAFLIALQGGSVETIALTGLAGEAISLLIAYALVALHEGLGPTLRRRAPLYGVALLVTALLVAIAAGLVQGPIPAIAAAALFLVVLALSARLHRYVAANLRRMRRGRDNPS